MKENPISIAKFIRELKDTCYRHENIAGNKIYQILRDNKVLYYDESKNNQPNQKLVESGDFIIKKYTEGRLIGEQLILLTNKGQKNLLKWLVSKNYIDVK